VTRQKKKAPLRDAFFFSLRGQDLNLRPLGYEPSELPSCSTPRHKKKLYHGFRVVVATGWVGLPARPGAGEDENMTSPHAEDSRDRESKGRDETPDERADRNWGEVLQELRVLQTGSQILSGFLLALAFQPGFADLSDGQRTFYLVLVVLAALSTILALAPVALHRGVFRQRMKHGVVVYGHVLLILALAAVAALVVGVVAFVFDVVVSTDAALVVGIVLGLLIAGLWIVAPMLMRLRRGENGSV
jgi:hypothetical protein